MGSIGSLLGITAALMPALSLTVAAAAPEPAKKPADEFTVTIKSTRDGADQKILFYCPPGAGREEAGEPVPLLVALHTWQGTYDQCMSYIHHARRLGWVMVAPHFRGPNKQPQACASELAVQDVLDSVEYARANARVDANRIYLIGGSGGGHMTLVMAHRAPQLWAAASAWCPITDLAAWHAENVINKCGYDKMLEGVCGGAPGPATEAEYRARSPLFHLAAAKDLPLEINAGIHDGHTGSVPISHTLRAFNVVAEANGFPEKRLSEEQIAYMVREQAVPADLAGEKAEDPERKLTVHFRRVAGPARVSIFEGGHAQETDAAIRWLARQRKGAPVRHEATAGETKPGAVGGPQEVAR